MKKKNYSINKNNKLDYSPKSGSEHNYDPDKWNKNYKTKKISFNSFNKNLTM